MRTLIVSPRAEHDLVEIWDYIAEDSRDAANGLIERIVAQFNQLLVYPQIGRSRPDLLTDLRCVPVGNYLIFYRELADDIEVFRVLHGARDVEEALDDPMESV